MIRTMVFFTDFLNAITLLYLFYCQAQAQNKEIGHHNQRSHKKDAQEKDVTFSKLIQGDENDLKLELDYSRQLTEDSKD